MNISDVLGWRYAVKLFSDEKINQEQVQELLNATRLSASSYGLQPYSLVVVESSDLRQQLLEYSYGQEKIAKSSHLVIFAAHTNIGDTTVDRYINKFSEINGVSINELQNMSDHLKEALAAKNEQQKHEWAHQQAYIALGNFLTCAAFLKIDTCPMTGFETEGYNKVLRLSEKGLTASAICPIGKRHPEDSNAHLKKVRFDYDEIVLAL